MRSANILSRKFCISMFIEKLSQFTIYIQCDNSVLFIRILCGSECVRSIKREYINFRLNGKMSYVKYRIDLSKSSTIVCNIFTCIKPFFVMFSVPRFERLTFILFSLLTRSFRILWQYLSNA